MKDLDTFLEEQKAQGADVDQIGPINPKILRSNEINIEQHPRTVIQSAGSSRDNCNSKTLIDRKQRLLNQKKIKMHNKISNILVDIDKNIAKC